MPLRWWTVPARSLWTAAYAGELDAKLTWSIRSAYHYNRNLDEYYRNLAAPGPDWGTQDWGKCVPFLLMLALALEGK